MPPESGIEFVCFSEGPGPAVLFLPGSFSTTAAWRPVLERLEGSYRIFATSLCGYGATEETRSDEDFGIEHLTDLVHHAAARIGGPFHLVGHSFGGTVALAAALDPALELLSLSLFEANPLALLLERGAGGLHDSTKRMSLAFEEALRSGERDAAGRIIDFWGGAGAFAALPESVQDYCRGTASSNVLDWKSDFAFEEKLSAYGRLGMPTLLVRGSLANPAMLEITEALAGALPEIRLEIVEGAGHFLITTHPEDCAALLSAHLEEAASAQRFSAGGS